MDKSKYETVLDQIYVGMKNEETAAEVSQYVSELYEFVRFIATDYVELSQDKVLWQRNDYIKRAKKILER